MKQLFALLTALALTCALTACGGTDGQNTSAPASASPSVSQSGDEVSPSPSVPWESGETADVLVAYFSATGNTAEIAASLQSILDADLYEIVPQVPYTSEDLNYSNDSCRANQEQNDPTARPTIDSSLESLDGYDVVFLGYPIWWGKAPKVIYTFLERYDLTGKTIVPFCTSGSSGIAGSLTELQALAPDALWLDGQRFSSGTSESTIAAWTSGLDPPLPANGAGQPDT